VKIANTDYVTDSTDNEINLYTTSVALYDGPTVISTEAKEAFGAIYRGYSAYDLAVQNGYTGTVSDWLASLKGADGKALSWSDMTDAQKTELKNGVVASIPTATTTANGLMSKEQVAALDSAGYYLLNLGEPTGKNSDGNDIYTLTDVQVNDLNSSIGKRKRIFLAFGSEADYVEFTSVIGNALLTFFPYGEIVFTATIDAEKKQLELHVDQLVNNESLDTKVDKVEGKSLSTNDLTDALLAKLNSLSNYDDTALAARVKTVEDSEVSRKSAEDARVAAENSRKTAENSRSSEEDIRKAAEVARKASEDARVATENARVASENTRNEDEKERSSSEAARVDAEAARVTEFSTLKTDSETAANNANTSASNANTAADNANAAAASATEVLNNVASLGTWVFMVRKHENADPSAYKFIGTQANIKLLGEHCRMGWFKNRTAYTICAKGRITKDTHGNDIAMDGTAGDLLTFFDCDVHHYENTVTDATDGVIDIIGLGLNPTILYGKGSSVMPAFGITTDHTVIAKLSSDTASCSHCIYSKSVNGTYSAPTTILFNEVYQSSGAGKPTVGRTSMLSIASSQNKNADGIHGDGWYGMYYICYQIWLEMMIMEGGTVCSTVTDTGFGVGNTMGDTPTSSTFSGSKIIGNSGVKFILSDGTVKGYGNLMDQNIKLSSTGSVVYNMLPLTGSSYYAWQDMLEAQRMADAIVKNGFESYVGTATNVFYYDDDGQLQVDTAGNIDLSTGTGMTANKRYYVVRGVNGYDGLSDGVMTCLVNYYIKMTFVDDAYYSDGTSLKGGFAIYKFSTPMYRGVSWFDGTCNHLQGFHYVIHADANGNYSSSAIYQPDYKALPSITSNDSANDYGLETDTLLMEKGFIHTESIPMTEEGWAKNCYPSISLFYCPNIGGAGMRTYESNYIWRNACWGEGVNGKPANGYKCIQASAVGCVRAAALLRFARCMLTIQLPTTALLRLRLGSHRYRHGIANIP
jgi:hypothetical protein